MKVVERVLVACAVLVTLVALPLAGHAGGARLWATSPFVRIGADGAAVHVDLLPADRAAYERAVIHDEVRYHGGPTIDRSATYAIFWQPAGSYVSPKYQSTIAQFLTDVGATPAYGILTQYYDRDGYPQNASAFAGSWTDTSAYPSPFDDRSFRTEVVKAIVANGWPAGGIRPIFFIFTASKAPDRFAACAYHGAFRGGRPHDRLFARSVPARLRSARLRHAVECFPERSGRGSNDRYALARTRRSRQRSGGARMGERPYGRRDRRYLQFGIWSDRQGRRRRDASRASIRHAADLVRTRAIIAGKRSRRQPSGGRCAAAPVSNTSRCSKSQLSQVKRTP